MSGAKRRIKVSNLSGQVWRDGVEIDVQIYRLTDRDLGWVLEVAMDGHKPVIWDRAFPNEGAAVSEFNRAVKEEGIQAFRVDRLRYRSTGRP